MNKVLLALCLLSSAALAQERDRESRQPTTQPAQTQEIRPDIAVEQRPGGRRGNQPMRQTPATPGPTESKVDETPVVTHHELHVGDKTLHYTATVAQMPIKNSAGDTEAHIFYMAYTLDDADHSKRPLTFAFNGGPGAASLWVHMGAMGPRRVKLTDTGDMPAPPFELVDNDQTWLGQTDLIFIDPVGTGYSRANSTAIARRMNGVQGDLQSVAEFMRMYITRNDRFLSPLFIAGESYGTFRAAGLAGYLIEEGTAVNGIVLISTVLNFASLRPNATNGLAYALHLPTFTADAWYHKKLPADLQKQELKAVLKEVENWAMNGYLQALDQGDAMTADQRKAAIDKLSRYTGLEPRYIDESDLHIDVGHFTRQLLRDKRLMIGRLDGRLTGPAPLNAGEVETFDPSSTLTRPPFQATFLHYLQSELNYHSDMTYYVAGGIEEWNWGVENGYADTTAYLRDAFQKNPHLKVLVCASYYDLATPYLAARYTFDHMGLHPQMHKNISWAYYESGHMMYIEKQSRAKLTSDVMQFMQQAAP
jgi:carboxypeptidase C (cathepsin A)